MILVYGGTTEGRAVCRVLDESGRNYYYSTKGDAQEIELVHGERITGAMTSEMMKRFITEHDIRLVVDAAHPFAAVLHRTIGEVTAELNIPVVRYERRYPKLDPRIIACQSYDEMIDRLLSQPSHRLLALTGVNTIEPMRRFWEQRESYFRILDRDDSRDKVREVGYPMERIRYFREGDDQALFDEIMPDAITTKESGESGFFDEKIAPALSAGVPVYMIVRPSLPEHYQTVNGPVGLRKAVERLAPDFFSLKTGFTTGSTATAATVAALLLMTRHECPSWVEITLPSGEIVSLPIEDIAELGDGVYKATARKYSGDDPDVTSGALITSTIARNDLGVVRFLRGEGVGVVTLPGIGIEVGEPAINTTPRAMMTAEVERYLGTGVGLDITIAVAEGEELAKKTFNPRLGIEGGISIIGTSGVVKPFSSEAFVASIVRQADVALALGADTIVIGSGAKSEGHLRKAYPEIIPQAFVQYGNFIGETLKKLAECHVPHIVMGIMLGKAVKLAEGNMDTHSRKVVMNKRFLHESALASGCSEHAHTVIESLTLARELWTNLSSEDLPKLMDHITRGCYEAGKRLIPCSELTVLLLDDEGTIRVVYNPVHKSSARVRD